MAGLDVTDFVMIRFATAPFYFMRMGHINISTWLDRRQIIWTRVRSRVYFQLPQEMEVYTVITPELAEKLAIVATEVKRRLMAISFSEMSKFRQPLSQEEVRCMVEANIPIIL